VVPCCKECNNAKKQLLPMEWEAYLKKFDSWHIRIHSKIVRAALKFHASTPIYQSKCLSPTRTPRFAARQAWNAQNLALKIINYNKTLGIYPS
jgi:hypothetical protein